MSHHEFYVIRFNFVSFNGCKLIYMNNLIDQADQGQKSQCVYPPIPLGAQSL